MQKKLIALAVAGLVSAPAFAQSNVQIYGVMDLGFRYLSGSEENGAHPGLKSRSAVDSSGLSTSRLGFRGTEDLGNGLKAFFTVEQALTPDTTSVGSSRQAFVGLEGGFGRVWLGRDFNPSRNLVAGLDPFGATGIGSGQALFEQTSRYSNGVYYRTPNFGGLTVSLAYTGNVSADELSEIRGATARNLKGWSVTPVYKNGPLTLGLGYEKYSGGTTTTDNDSSRWNVGGGYDFGVVDLRLAYGQSKTDVTGGSDDKRKSWMLAGVIPVSERGKILASYVQTKLDTTGSDEKARLYAAGYQHDLSKRTAVYAIYAQIRGNSASEGNYSLGEANPGPRNTVGVAGTPTFGSAGYTRGINVGVRHNF